MPPISISVRSCGPSGSQDLVLSAVPERRPPPYHVAIHGNAFGSFLAAAPMAHLPPVAKGCKSVIDALRVIPHATVDLQTQIQLMRQQLRASRGRAPLPLRARGSDSRSRGASSSCTADGSGSRASLVAAAASPSRCRSRSSASMAGERVLDTVQVHPSDRDAGTLATRSGDHDHRRMTRGNPRRQGRCGSRSS